MGRGQEASTHRPVTLPAAEHLIPPQEQRGAVSSQPQKPEAFLNTTQLSIEFRNWSNNCPAWTGKPYHPSSYNTSNMSPADSSMRSRPQNKQIRPMDSRMAADALLRKLIWYVSKQRRLGLLSASAEPEMGCCASAASRKRTEHNTTSQLPRLGILFPHLTAERSILVAPQGLRPMRYSLKAPALSVFV